MNKNIIYIAIGALLLVGVAAGAIYYNSQLPKTKEEVTISKKIDTPEKNQNNEFISTLAEFKVKSKTDKYTITYPRNKFKSEELSAEIKKVLAKTDMNDANKTSIMAGAILNESFYSDTTSECGLTEPSSSWCFRLSNDKDKSLVTIVVQKGKFTAIQDSNSSQ